MSTKSKKDLRIRRHFRVRNKVKGTAARPRMAVFRSNKRLEVQFIDDDARLTLAGVSINGKNAEAAKALGSMAAEAAKGKGIETVVFDRGGFAFGNNFRALAESAREAGLKF
ncbi:MAG: 50S ribosomal protein L18 [Pontiellaceae bacterium]|jgi:large subunit ribosomal protein L18|nr:50S ribosomal protein L18 [Pontiellaceae bacterium]NLX26886.1 50S ribosomal protein L18 [Lentisphaerota bacterium]